MRIHRAIFVLAVGAVLGLGLFLTSEASVVHADDCTWWGGYSEDSWHDPDNWSCGLVPDGDDTAIVGSGTVNVDSDATVLNLTQSGGVIQGAYDVTVVGVFTWSGGTQTGAGRTTVDVGALSTLEGGTKILDGRELENRGSATWNAGMITVKNAATIENLGVFEINADADLSQEGGEPSTFWNGEGAVVRKVGGVGTTQVPLHFHNVGLVQVLAGTLQLRLAASVSSSSGEFLVDPDGTLEFYAGTHTLEAGSWVHGGGRVWISGATVTVLGDYDVSGVTEVSGGGATFAPTATVLDIGGSLVIRGGGELNLGSGESHDVSELNQSGGTLSGGDVVTVSGAFTWSGGTQTGAGRTTVDVGALSTLEGGTKILDGRELENRGSATWNAGMITVKNAATIENLGVFEINADADLSQEGVEPSTFWNGEGAIVRKVGGVGTTQVPLHFHNAGLVQVLAGTLQLRLAASVSSSSGEFLVDPDGTLEFYAGTHTLEAGSWVHGGGRVWFSGATVTVLGDYDVGGVTEVSGGTATLDGATGVALGDLLLRGGILNVSNQVTISGHLTRNGGTFNAGTGTFTFDGTSEQAIGGTQAAPFYNLVMAEGATVVVPSGATAPTVGGTMTNDGTLKQTQDLDNTLGTEEATFAFLNIEDGAGGDKYFGLDITIGAGVEMGTTVVTIQGNQTCGPENTVLRCYEIDPLYDVESTVRFYYRAAEANDNVLPYAWHLEGSDWQNVDLSPTRDTTNPEGYWVEAEGIDSYSPFALSDDEPGTYEGYLYVKSITLRLLGSGQIVGTVRIVDDDNNAVAGATVKVQWTLPGGSTRTQQAKTKKPGSAQFRLKADEPGTYTLLVTSVEYEDWLYVPSPGGDWKEIYVQ